MIYGILRKICQWNPHGLLTP